MVVVSPAAVVVVVPATVLVVSTTEGAVVVAATVDVVDKPSSFPLSAEVDAENAKEPLTFERINVIRKIINDM